MNKRNLSDEDLDRLLADLSKSAYTPSERFSAENSYLEFKEKMSMRHPKRLRILRYIAAASILLLVAISTYVLFNRYDDNTKLLVVSTSNQIKEILLPDGTTVTLSHYSSLTYPDRFDDANREVSLEGEGYFQVAKDKKHPFIVSAQDVRIKVLGTHFNIQSYINDPYIKTTLVEGSIEVSNINNSEKLLLEPAQAAIFCKTTSILRKDDVVRVQSEIAWKSGKFIFDHLPMSYIVRELSNYYNVTIRIADQRLSDYKVTACFDNKEDLSEILTLLQDVASFDWTKEGNTIIIKP